MAGTKGEKERARWRLALDEMGAARRALDEGQQESIERAFAAGIPVIEIAERLGITRRTAYYHLRKSDSAPSDGELTE